MKRLSMVGLFAVIAAMAGGGYWYWQKSATESAAKATAVAQASKDGAGDAKGAEGKGKEGKGKDAKGKGGGPIPVRTIGVQRQSMPVVIDAVGDRKSVV